MAPEGQAAGPVVRVRFEVCDWPVWSVQVSEIESPGWYLTRTWATSSGLETVWPPTAVIVSPWPRPALAAGDPERVPEMATPLVLPWLPLCPPKPGKPPKPLPDPLPDPLPKPPPDPLPEPLL